MDGAHLPSLGGLSISTLDVGMYPGYQQKRDHPDPSDPNPRPRRRNPSHAGDADKDDEYILLSDLVQEGVAPPTVLSEAAWSVALEGIVAWVVKYEWWIGEDVWRNKNKTVAVRALFERIKNMEAVFPGTWDGIGDKLLGLLNEHRPVPDQNAAQRQHRTRAWYVQQDLSARLSDRADKKKKADDLRQRYAAAERYAAGSRLAAAEEEDPGGSPLPVNPPDDDGAASDRSDPDRDDVADDDDDDGANHAYGQEEESVDGLAHAPRLGWNAQPNAQGAAEEGEDEQTQAGPERWEGEDDELEFHDTLKRRGWDSPPRGPNSYGWRAPGGL